MKKTKQGVANLDILGPKRKKSTARELPPDCAFGDHEWITDKKGVTFCKVCGIEL